jgi:hypothetical protein
VFAGQGMSWVLWEPINKNKNSGSELQNMSTKYILAMCWVGGIDGMTVKVEELP